MLGSLSLVVFLYNETSDKRYFAAGTDGKVTVEVCFKILYTTGNSCDQRWEVSKYEKGF